MLHAGDRVLGQLLAGPARHPRPRVPGGERDENNYDNNNDNRSTQYSAWYKMMMMIMLIMMMLIMMMMQVTTLLTMSTQTSGISAQLPPVSYTKVINNNSNSNVNKN